jgi:hypothetical protein
MSSMRYAYSKLGLKFFSVEENRSHTPKKPFMVEEAKNGGAEDSTNMFLKKALTR